jgi:adhesin/invasin
MRPLSRKLLSLYLACSVAFSPLAPAVAQVHAAATAEQLMLPELGSAAATPAAPPDTSNASTEWLSQAQTHQDLAPNALQKRSQGVDDAVAQSVGLLSGAASQASQNWFASHHITSEVALNAGNGGIRGGSLDLLMPFYNEGKNLLFVQSGIRRANSYTEDYRHTVNLGLGYRRNVSGWLLGGNSFYDWDVTGKNARLGVGVEAWTDFVKLSANGYQPLSSWKTSPDQADHLERPAKGWDVRAEGYLPTYPQLGATLAYEQFYGNEVSLFSADDRQKDPHALSVGAIYNPVPLVGLSINHRMGQQGLSDTSANLVFNYRLGEPLAKQLSSDNLMASRMLENMRYDLVARNHEIVLEQKKAGAQIGLPKVISDTELKTVQFLLTGAAGVSAINWQGSAASFALPYDGSGQGTLQLPAYVSGGANTYNLQAVGTDKSGRAVVSNSMAVVVQSMGIVLTANPLSIPATGTHTSTLKVKITDQGQPRAAGVVINWSTTAGKLSSTTSTTDNNGEASVTLTSSTTAGVAVVEAAYGAVKRTVSVTFAAGAASALTVVATPDSIAANGTSTSTLSATVKDAHGNLVGAGTTVAWTTNAGDLASPSSTTNASGVASVLLTSSTTAGTATVQASVGSVSGSGSVTFTVGAANKLDLSASPTSIEANGTSTTTLSATVKDAHNNPVGSGTTVAWTTSAGKLASPTSVTNGSGVATVVLTSSTTVGEATVQASTGAANGSSKVTFTVGAPATLAVTASPASIEANGRSTSTLSATVKDANGNLVAGSSVAWTTSAGGLGSNSSLTNSSGVASVVLTSSTTAGDATVEATAGSAKGSSKVTFAVGAASKVEVSANPTSIEATGASTTTLSATVKDAHDNPVSGIAVAWSTSGGTLGSPSTLTNASGVATVELTSSTTVGDATVQARAGSATGTGTVAFVPVASNKVEVSASPTSIVANGTSTTTLSATVKNAQGNAMGSGISVSWTTSAGMLGSTSSTTNGSGVATVVLTSSTTAGTATVRATGSGATGSASVAFTAGTATAITLSATPSSIVADGASNAALSATVKDVNGNLVSGTTVAWSTNRGAVDKGTSVTNANGVATAVLTSSTSAGDATVRASVGSVNTTGTVTFAPGVAHDVTVSASPTSIEANGTSTSTLSATVKDANGNLVGSGKTVAWTTSAGSLASPSTVTDSNSVASVVLTSSKTAGTANVRASSGTGSGTASVAFAAGTATAITLSTSTGSIVADGKSTSALTATVKDANGNGIGGVTVGWTTTLGALDAASSVTDASGVAKAVLTSGTKVGEASVQASAGAISASGQVSFTPGVPHKLTLTSSTPGTGVDSTIKLILSAEVKDAAGNPVVTGTTVNWITSLGTLVSATSLTDDRGVATVELLRSTTLGTATIQASSGTVKDSTSIMFVAGQTHSLTLSAAPNSIAANGTSTSTVSVTMKDVYGNPTYGRLVSWTTTSGRLDRTFSNADENGIATVVLTSSTTAGTATVEASSGAEKASISVAFTVVMASEMPLIAAHDSLAADGSNPSAFNTQGKLAAGLMACLPQESGCNGGSSQTD